MKFQDYILKVRNRFEKTDVKQIDLFDVEVSYQEKFELKWLATKLKIFNFVCYSEKIDQGTIRNFSQVCFEYSKKNYKGLPRGLQNGFASFSALVSENIDADAIEFVKSRPKMHFSAFEMPIIIDLKNEKIFYYNQTPIWGKIYYKFFRDYIEKSYNFHRLNDL